MLEYLIISIPPTSKNLEVDDTDGDTKEFNAKSLKTEHLDPYLYTDTGMEEIIFIPQISERLEQALMELPGDMDIKAKVWQGIVTLVVRLVLSRYEGIIDIIVSITSTRQTYTRLVLADMDKLEDMDIKTKVSHAMFIRNKWF